MQRSDLNNHRHFYLVFFYAILISIAPYSYLNAQADNLKEYIEIRNPCYNPGMFCVLGTVLGVLFHYENGDYTGLKVDFKNQGLYYDSNRGPNWWQYYFEPISIGSKKKDGPIRCFENEECITYDMFIQKQLTPEQNFGLIQKYVKLKPHIKTKLEDYIRDHFENCFVIGVHYRGTDKYLEAPRVSYESVKNALIDQMYKLRFTLKGKSIKIFVATDEQDFLNYIKKTFKKHVIYQDIQRSENGQPLHYTLVDSPYQIGKDALLDCLLLSRCDILMRTASRLSLWSSYFNPHIPIINLNYSYY